MNIFKRTILFALPALLACAASPQPVRAEPVSSARPATNDTACVVTASTPTIKAASSLSAVVRHTSIMSKDAGNMATLFGPLGGLGLLFFVGSVNDTVADDKDSYGARQSTRQQLDNLVRDVAYLFTHRPAWQVAAAAVAPPVLATATVTTQVKSTATTQLMVNGVLTSLTATDPLLLAANIAAGDPNVLAIGSVRRWQVCWDATNATTVISCRPSNDQVIANFATSALARAACRWTSLPPKGTVIVGIADIVNVTNAFTPGTTLLGAAGVTATYIDGPDQNCLTASLVSP